MLKFLLIPALSLSLISLAQAQDESPRGVDSAPPAPSSARGTPAGSASSTQTCTDSCNRSYDVCMDQQSAEPGEGGTLRYQNELADKLIGATSNCSDHLRSCLNTCGG